MAFRRALSSRCGLIGAILAIMASAIGGGVYVQRNVIAVEAEIPALEAGRLRDGLVAFGDLNRLTLALAQAGAAARSDRIGLEAALDYLYVRADTLARALRGEAGVEQDLAEQLPAALNRVIAAGDAALTASARDRPDADAELLSAIGDANARIIRYVNAQQHAQIAAIGAQSRALLGMSLSSGALLVVFALISSAALILLRAELRAHIRRRDAERRARYLAYFDPMTGLANRTRFTEAVEAALAKRASAGAAPALALIDLDDFKKVNDTHGHAMGDAFLKAVAGRIDSVAREHGGMAARLGGDEFAALAPLAPTEAALEAFSRRMLDAIRAPLTIGGAALAPRASLGLAPADLDVSHAGQLLKRADLALYEVKNNGRDGWVAYDSALDAAVRRRIALERDLSGAIGRGELFLVYQPQVRIADGAIYGFEALARWRRPDGVATPAQFIQVAEQNGLIIDIDLWGLREATMQLARWRRAGLASAGVSVNLSPLHFRSEAIVASVAEALEASRLPPRLLTIEVTETVLLQDWPTIARVIGALRALGVKIALDDFGSGYSSLNYLRRLTADQVKIDRSFVPDLEGSAEARAILTALVELSRALDMDLLVEGVETPAQRRLLQELGCLRAQGYLFSRPVEADVAGAMLGGARAA